MVIRHHQLPVWWARCCKEVRCLRVHKPISVLFQLVDVVRPSFKHFAWPVASVACDCQSSFTKQQAETVVCRRASWKRGTFVNKAELKLRMP